MVKSVYYVSFSSIYLGASVFFKDNGCLTDPLLTSMLQFDLEYRYDMPLEVVF